MIEADAAKHLGRVVGGLRSRVLAAGASDVADDLSKIQHAVEVLRRLLVELPDRLAEIVDAEGRRRLRHDLRTPLNQILGYCELVKEEAEDAGDARWHADLDVILGGARDLLDRVDRMGEDDTQSVAQRPTSSPPPSSSGVFASADSVVGGSDDSPGTILVVDDNPANRALLERRLSRDGLVVVTAGDGAEALRIVGSRCVDVVLLDIMMPVMDGYATLERIKGDPELRHLPVIMLSSLDEPESITRCIENGAEDHLPKPFDPVLLRARIGSSLERKRARDLERAYLRRILTEKRRADDLLHGVIPIGVALSAERDFNRLLERVLREARRFCGADGGALLLRDRESLSYVLMQCASLDLSLGGSSEDAVDLPSFDLEEASRIPAAIAAREGRTVNLGEPFDGADLDLRSIRAFEQANDYRIRSIIVLPLRTVDGDVVGVLQLWNATRADSGDVVAFEGGIVDVLESLSRLAGAAMDSYRRENELRQRIRRLEIRIDEANRRREVSEITETDYFRKLRAMAQKLRGDDETAH
jgi:CheY-like chemotaxis protein